jgi:hypothetical protein
MFSKFGVKIFTRTGHKEVWLFKAQLLITGLTLFYSTNEG